MRPVNVRKGMGKSFLPLALFLGLGILLTFNPSLTSSAAADDDGPTGIMSGGGVWVYTRDLDLSGFTYFSMRANFPGQASGGFVYVQGEKGWFRIALDPEYTGIKDGSWIAFTNVPGRFVTLEGNAIWGVGQIVAADHEDWEEGGWAFVGAYDGANCEGESDYLIAWPGHPETRVPITESGAKWLYSEAMVGNQYIPFLVFLVQGNAVLNIHDD